LSGPISVVQLAHTWRSQVPGLRTRPALGPLLMSLPGFGASHWIVAGRPQLLQRGLGARVHMIPRIPLGREKGMQGIRVPA
jgi:hypothetical protein